MTWITSGLVVALALLWPAACAHAQQPRLFGTLSLGPVGESAVRAQSRELAGPTAAGFGLGARADLAVHANVRIGLALGLVLKTRYALRPYTEEGSPHIDGVIGDLVFAVRPVVWLDPGNVQLELSLGVGVTGRVDTSGWFPLTTPDGSTQPGQVASANGWGPLAVAGVGSSFWLTPRMAVLIELQAIARQTNAVVEDESRGDYLMQINDLHAMLLFGFGVQLGAP